MSLQLLVETIVHFEQFKNIDLYHQGLYFLKTSLYHIKHGEVRPVLRIKISLENLWKPTAHPDVQGHGGEAQEGQAA